MIKLLIVEDEQIIRRGLEHQMPWTNLGVDEVYTAPNTETGLKMFYERKPNIIISDIKMPGMTGVELCARIREEDADCQIIFISGYSDKEYLKAAISIGVVNYVEKPIDMEELSSAVKKAIKRLEQVGIYKKQVGGDTTASLDMSEIGTLNGKNPQLMKKVMQYMHEHLGDKNISIQMIADAFYLSPTYLSGLFKKSTGMTIGQYLTDIRIKKAKELLETSNMKLYQVAAMAGYEDANYFAKIFKKHEGVLPSEYRESRG